MAIRNTYEKKTKGKQVLKRKGQAHGNFIVSGCGAGSPFCRPRPCMGRGDSGCRDRGWGVESEALQGLHGRGVQRQDFWKYEHRSRRGAPLTMRSTAHDEGHHYGHAILPQPPEHDENQKLKAY